MKSTEEIKAAEQSHLNKVIEKIKATKNKLKLNMQRAENDVKGIRDNFGKEVKMTVGGDSISMDTALSIHQQQQMLDERNNSYNNSQQRLKILDKQEDMPYFARLDFEEEAEGKTETVYIGLSSVTEVDDEDQFLIYDWRAPISSVYYDGSLGKVSYESPDGKQEVELYLKRQFVVKDGKIEMYFDTKETIGDQMLLEALGGKSSTQMKGIVTTIQQEQNKIIRDTDSDLLFVQGAAGSGKTSAILQRIAFLLYRYRGNLTSSQVVMFSPNQLFNDYVKNVLPEMGEQNMVQMTYLQYVARRLPKLNIQTLHQQFATHEDDEQLQVDKFMGDLAFFNLVTKYSEYLNREGVAFRDIKLHGKVLFDKEQISEIYYSFGEQYNLGNRLDSTKDELVKRLNRRMGSETRSKWVSQAIENLTQEELRGLYDKPDQEFKSEEEEHKFLAKKIVAKEYQSVYRKVRHGRFFNISANYLNFLHSVPHMVDLKKYNLTEKHWEDHITQFINNMKSHNMNMADISPYLYLYDLILGKKGDNSMRFVFIDEIQDYTPFQLAYLKFNFPRAKYTMLGDLNQAIFTKNRENSLLLEVQKMFDPDKTNVVQLTHSYRSTKQITNFTKALLTNGQKIEPFNREGELPNVIVAHDEVVAMTELQKQVKTNDSDNYTTAIITRTLDDANRLSDALKDTNLGFNLIRSENQRLPEGLIVIPSYLAKGLEFDAVIVWDASKDAFANEDQQLIYTIASRAMHRLTMIAIKEPTHYLERVPKEIYTYTEV